MYIGVFIVVLVILVVHIFAVVIARHLCLAIVIVICCFLESSPGTPAEIYLASSFPRYDFIVVAD